MTPDRFPGSRHTVKIEFAEQLPEHRPLVVVGAGLADQTNSFSSTLLAKGADAPAHWHLGSPSRLRL